MIHVTMKQTIKFQIDDNNDCCVIKTTNDIYSIITNLIQSLYRTYLMLRISGVILNDKIVYNKRC